MSQRVKGLGKSRAVPEQREAMICFRKMQARSEVGLAEGRTDESSARRQ